MQVVWAAETQFRAHARSFIGAADASTGAEARQQVLKAERDRDKAPPDTWCAGKTPRIATTATVTTAAAAAARRRQQIEEARLRGHENKEARAGQARGARLVRKETDRVRADLDREASRAPPAARSATAARRERAGGPRGAQRARRRLPRTDREKARTTKSRGASTRR